MKVSIILATLNGQRYLPEQLSSIASQSTPPNEVIISDDGSTDETISILREFASGIHKFPTRLVVNPRRLGHANNFLNAARLATSDWISFCDQDDIWLPDKLQCLNQYRDTDVLGIAHTATIINAASEVLYPCNQGIAKTRIAEALTRDPWTGYYGFSLACRKSLVSHIPFDLRPSVRWGNQTLPHDDYISFLINSLGSVAEIDRPLVKWRHHGSNTSGSSIWKSRSLIKQIRDGMGRDVEMLSHRIEECEARRLFLENHVQNVYPSRFVSDAIRMYRKLREVSERRLALWSSQNTTAAMKNVTKLIFSGAYRQYSFGGMGKRTFVKDVLFGTTQRLKFPQ